MKKSSCRIFCVGSGMNVRQTVKRIIRLPHISAIIRCVRLACQPTSQQYCSLILNQHQSISSIVPHNKSSPAISHNLPEQVWWAGLVAVLYQMCLYEDTKPLLRCLQNSKTLLYSPSHRIFECVHEVLNVAKQNN